MPSGYTAALHAGDQSFRDFVLACSSAMGASLDLRDESLDAPSRRFEPSDHYFEATAKGERRLLDLGDDETATKMFLAAVMNVDVHNREGARSVSDRAGRYGDMLGRVRAWEPPTPDHVGLKDFMVEQLEESSLLDCFHSALVVPAFDEWRTVEIAHAQRRLADAHQSWIDEQRRTDQRNAWFDALLASIAIFDESGPDRLEP